MMVMVVVRLLVVMVRMQKCVVGGIGMSSDIMVWSSVMCHYLQVEIEAVINA